MFDINEEISQNGNRCTLLGACNTNTAGVYAADESIIQALKLIL